MKKMNYFFIAVLSITLLCGCEGDEIDALVGMQNRYALLQNCIAQGADVRHMVE